MILLTLLAVFCSLPLITLGASLSALYYTAFKMLEHDNENTIRNFFHSFRQNLIQGIGISLLLLGSLRFRHPTSSFFAQIDFGGEIFREDYSAIQAGLQIGWEF